MKNSCSTYLICSLVLLLTISLKLVASYRMCLPFLLAFTSLWSLHLYAVRRNHVKEISGSFKDPARVGLVVLKKIVMSYSGLQARKVDFLFPK